MKKFLEFLSIATLFAWGVAFLYFYGTGKIEAYLDPSFRIYALVAGIGMLLLSAFNFMNRDRVTGVCTHDLLHGGTSDHGHHEHEHGHDCAHDHHHHHHHEEDHHHDHDESAFGIGFAVVVLLIPLFTATAMSKDKFSAEYLTKWGTIERQMMQMRIAEREGKQQPREAVAEISPDTNPYTREAIDPAVPGEDQPTDADTPPDRESTAKAEDAPAGSNESWSTFTMEDLKNLVPQSEAGDFLLDVPQIFYTAGDKELMAVMEGIPVETTAQLMEETLSNPEGNRLKAFRLFIECCAADARPLSIPVEFADGVPEYTEMGWYKLYGNLHFSREDDGIVPILKMNRIEKTVEPVDGLLF